MLISKSATFGDEDLSNAASAVELSPVRSSADSAFVERLKSGDAAAFDVFVNRFSGDVYALLFRLTKDVDEAADLTQETFLNALRSIRKFRGDSELKTWLFRIAINESRNRFRWWKRRKRDNTISLDANVGDTDQQIYETIASREKTPEDNLLAYERADALDNALQNLPDIFREAIVLCDIEGLSYNDAAQALDINIGTIKSRIARGRIELRKRLKDF